MIISLSTGSLYVYPLPTVCRLARQAGFQALEIGVNPEAIARGGEAVGRLAAAHGLRVLSVHPTVIPLPGWREKHGGLGRTIRLAQAAGAQVVVCHTVRSPTLDAGAGLAFRQEIEAWQSRLAGGSVRLAIENKAIHAEQERHLALTPLSRLRAFADRYDLGLVLDTTHAGSAGDELLAARRLFGERLANVHVSDLGARRLGRLPPIVQTVLEQHCFPGSGDLPLADLVAELARDGYAGPLTLEVSPLSLRLWWPPAVRRRLALAAAWIHRAAGLPPLTQAADRPPASPRR